MPNGTTTRPAFLLTTASYYGSLAAARCLGRAGIPVTVADSQWLAAARWSRFVTRRVRAPSAAEPNRLLRFLDDFGAREPGHVLYPTSDELAWLFALYRDRLSRRFRLWMPEVDAVWALLDKNRLHARCERAGLDVPATWFPADLEQLEALAPRLPYPVLVKPRTQVYLASHIKGIRVQDPQQLREAWDAWSRQRYAPKLLGFDPRARLPMIQAYLPESADRIYSVSGIVESDGRIVAARAARKVLQAPRKLGIGLCFEEATVEPEQLAGLERLFREVGYFGVFEVEFITCGDRNLLIDANPRFYSQMAFDIDRGMPLPLYVYAAALGEARPAMDPVKAAGPGKRVYAHRVNLELLLWLQSLSGRVSPSEREHWQRWCEEGLPRSSDAVIDPEDLLPAAADLVTNLRSYARHPRSFLRNFVFDTP